MDVKAYDKRADASGDHGQSYERKLVTYALLRCVKEKRITAFRIASNVKGAGAFDDLVVQYSYLHHESTASKTIFLQAKHKDDKRWVDVDTLLDGAANEFSLKKYLDSYVDIVDKYRRTAHGRVVCAAERDCAYVICSNRRLRTNAGAFEEVPVPIGDDEPLDLVTCENCENRDGAACRHVYHRIRDSEKLERWIASCGHAEDAARLFLSRLRLHFGQASEKSLPQIVRLEMKSYWRDNLAVEFIYTYVGNRVENWWRYDNVYLTEANNFFEHADRLLEVLKLSRQPRLVGALELCRFRRESLAELEGKIEQGSKAINVLVRKEANVLAVMKVLQTVGVDCFLWDVGNDRITADMLLGIENLVEYVIVNFDSEPTSSDTLDKLCDAARKKSKTVVFVMEDGCVDLRRRLGEKFGAKYCEIVEENVKLSNLDEESMLKVGEYDVLFQGDLTDVRSISWDDSHTSELLVSVIEGKEIKIGKSLKSANNNNNTYVDRMLERVVLEKECLRDSKLALAISGWENSYVLGMSDSAETFNFKINDLENFENFINIRVFLLSNDGDFERVRSKRDNVHWLRIIDQNIHLVRSTGIVEDLRKYVSKKSLPLEAKKILEGLDKLTVVSAEPGMGKTTLLDGMSGILRYRGKAVWKIRIDLIYKKEKIEKLTPEKLLEFLKDQSELTTRMEAELFEHYFDEGNILVMLDGYDEVSAMRRDRVDRMIEIFAECNSLASIITSRTHEIVHLENKFGTLAHRLRPFSRDDAKLFLQNFSGTPLGENGIEKLYDKIRATLGEAFLENPLYLGMVGEYVADSLERGETPDFRINILQLFRYFVEKKIDIYCNAKGNVAGDVEQPKFKRKFNAKHQIMALHALFGRERLPLLGRPNDDGLWRRKVEKALSSVEDRRRWLRAGLVRDFSAEGEAVFVHRTFAEYFAATLLADVCVEEGGAGGDFLRAIRFYDERHRTLRKFFDWAVVEKDDDRGGLACHAAVLRGDLEAARRRVAGERPRDRAGRTALHLAVSHAAKHDGGRALDALVEAGDDDVADRLFGWRPLVAAAYHAANGSAPTSIYARLAMSTNAAEGYGALNDYVDDDDRRRLLRFAATNDLVDLARALVEDRDRLDGHSLLSLCAVHNSVNVARFVRIKLSECEMEKIRELAIEKKSYDFLLQTDNYFTVPTKDYPTKKNNYLLDMELRVNGLQHIFRNDFYFKHKQSADRNGFSKGNDNRELVHDAGERFYRSFSRPIDDETTFVCNIDYLLENEEKFIFICGEKGIGKTKVLQVIIENYKNVFESVNMIDLEKFNADAVDETSESCALLLDNFNAANAKHAQILAGLSSSDFRKVFVASRERNEDVERRLNTSAYTLDRLSRYAQMTVLRRAARAAERRPPNDMRANLLAMNCLVSCAKLFGGYLPWSFFGRPPVLRAIADHSTADRRSRSDFSALCGRIFAAAHSNDVARRREMAAAAVVDEFGVEFARRLFPGASVEGAARRGIDLRPFKDYLVATKALDAVAAPERKDEAIAMVLRLARRAPAFDLLCLADDGRLRLHAEVAALNARGVATLLDADPSALDRRDALGRAPLHLAAIHADPGGETMRLLLERGADAAAEDRLMRWRPLCYAVYFGDGEAVRTLAAREDRAGVFEAAERVRAFVDDDKRLSIAHSAICHGHAAVVDAMLDDGEPLVNAFLWGETLLHRAVEERNSRIAEMLLRRKGADAFARDQHGRSPLEKARALPDADDSTRLLFERLYPRENDPPPPSY